MPWVGVWNGCGIHPVVNVPYVSSFRGVMDNGKIPFRWGRKKIKMLSKLPPWICSWYPGGGKQIIQPTCLLMSIQTERILGLLYIWMISWAVLSWSHQNLEKKISCGKGAKIPPDQRSCYRLCAMGSYLELKPKNLLLRESNMAHAKDLKVLPSFKRSGTSGWA